MATWEITITCHDGSRLRFSELRGHAPKKDEIIETADAGKIIKAKIDACHKNPPNRGQLPRIFQGPGQRNIELQPEGVECRWSSRHRQDQPTDSSDCNPANVCLVATVLPSGFAQVSPRGSTMVYDDEHLALWERGKGSVNANLTDGTKVTIFLRKIALRESGLLPKGGIARFYGTAKLHHSGPVYEEIWKRLIQPEKDRDPQKKGFGVLIKVEHAEDLDGKPLDIK